MINVLRKMQHDCHKEQQQAVSFHIAKQGRKTYRGAALQWRFERWPQTEKGDTNQIAAKILFKFELDALVFRAAETIRRSKWRELA